MKEKKRRQEREKRGDLVKYTKSIQSAIEYQNLNSRERGQKRHTRERQT